MPINSVKIRMYRHGFGDCFLLQFFEDTVRKFTMLIDCGLKYNDSIPGVSLADVEQNIREVLNGGKGKKKPHLDVLVVTHEHWDHVSGFHPEEKLFSDFSIAKIWMAWTENPEDEEAILIKKHQHKSAKALKLASEKVKKAKSSQPGFYNTHVREGMELARKRFNDTLEHIAEFYGPLGVVKTPSGISLKDSYKISVDTQRAMDRLKEMANDGSSSINYYYPGDVITATKMSGIRIYVLGPPKGALLNKDAPSSGSKKEVYFGLDNAAMTGFVDGLLAVGDVDYVGADSGAPFSEVNMISEDQAKRDPYFQHSYFAEENAWRDISDDWLNMAGALAMQLDSDTNNTSLALAIEFVETGKVMLFPGDAQVGNWLSWHEHTWNVKNSSRREEIVASQLLENTVFYKAGHHLSHNATLKALGLELMNNSDLVAFVPEKQDQYNGIPYKPLVDRLKQKTRGRLIFSADTNFPCEDVLKHKPKALDKDEWDALKASLVVDKLYVEYTLAG